MDEMRITVLHFFADHTLWVSVRITSPNTHNISVLRESHQIFIGKFEEAAGFVRFELSLI